VSLWNKDKEGLNYYYTTEENYSNNKTTKNMKLREAPLKVGTTTR
jgi:hypothetical protein